MEDSIQNSQNIITSVKEALLELEKVFDRSGIKDLPDLVVKLTDNLILGQIFSKNKNVDKMGAETSAIPEETKIGVEIEKESITYFVEKFFLSFSSTLSQFLQQKNNLSSGIGSSPASKTGPLTELSSYQNNILKLLDDNTQQKSNKDAIGFFSRQENILKLINDNVQKLAAISERSSYQKNILKLIEDNTQQKANKGSIEFFSRQENILKLINDNIQKTFLSVEKFQIQSGKNSLAFRELLLNFLNFLKQKSFVEGSTFNKGKKEKSDDNLQINLKELDGPSKSSKNAASKGILSLLLEIFATAGLAMLALNLVPGIKDLVMNSIDQMQKYIIAPFKTLQILLNKNTQSFIDKAAKGFSSNTIKTLSGQFESLDGKIQTISKTGSTIIDDMAKSALETAKLVDASADVANVASKTAKGSVGLLGNVFKTIGDGLKGLMKGFIGAIGKGVSGLVGMVGKFLGPVGSIFHVMDMIDYIQKGDIFNALLSLVAAASSVFTGGMLSVIITGLQLSKISDSVGGLIGGGEDKKTSFQEALGKTAFGSILTLAPKLLSSVGSFLIKTLPKFLSGFVGKIFGFLKFIFNKLPFIGSIFYIADAINYFQQGKIAQAILAIIAAVTTSIPVLGTILSFIVPFLQAMFDNKDPINLPQGEDKPSKTDVEAAKSSAEIGKHEAATKKTQVNVTAEQMKKVAEEGNKKAGKIASEGIKKIDDTGKQLEKLASGMSEEIQEAAKKVQKIQLDTVKTIVDFYGLSIDKNKKLIEKVINSLNQEKDTFKGDIAKSAELDRLDYRIESILQNQNIQEQKLIGLLKNRTDRIINYLYNSLAENISAEIIRIGIENKKTAVIDLEKTSLQKMVEDVGEIKNFLLTSMYSLGNKMISALENSKNIAPSSGKDYTAGNFLSPAAPNFPFLNSGNDYLPKPGSPTPDIFRNKIELNYLSG